MEVRWIAALAAVLALAGAALPAHAGITLFTDRAAWETAAGRIRDIHVTFDEVQSITDLPYDAGPLVVEDFNPTFVDPDIYPFETDDFFGTHVNGTPSSGCSRAPIPPSSSPLTIP